MKIKPFLQNLIKANIFYIIANVVIFVLIIVNIVLGIKEQSRYNSKISVLKVEISQLVYKINLMRDTIPASEKLDEDLKLLNSLIPNVEDYFSIIYSLEKLSQKSNFIITKYTVNIENSTKGKLALKVTGTGDSQSFIKFLKSYNFEGDRLITSDSIKIDPNFFGSIEINLAFYSKTVSTKNNLEITPDGKIFNELDILKSRVNFNNNIASNSANLDYPKKSNPF